MALRHPTNPVRSGPYPPQMPKAPFRVDEHVFDPAPDIISWSHADEVNEANEANELHARGHVQAKLDGLLKEIERLQKQIVTDDQGASDVHVRRRSGDSPKRRAENSGHSRQDQPRPPPGAYCHTSQRFPQDVFSLMQVLQDQVKGLHQQLTTGQDAVSQQISELRGSIAAISSDLSQQTALLKGNLEFLQDGGSYPMTTFAT
ncbi:hypothetical protein N3K66_009078 [Trichothecium roseum]|uniref:Uncharacterized protein n=2 Tax=Trichothecium roseum TaxID=47278 RepID=A0ACC0UPT0_9HYPO|nr:hypothetical protein N3K66_009072 [Trichothecium roseum]KAI9896009.1 hypothetical protein N3K66_009078 [Trichothecium roseum]